MASRSQILVDNNTSFPDNTTSLITPQILRDYNSELANSVVFNDQTGSMSVANATSASFASTASFALNAGSTINTGSFATTGSNTFTGINTFNAGTNFNAVIATGNAVSFTASRFSPTVANFADLEMLDQNRFGFNVKDKNALTSGSEFTAIVNSGSQFTEVGFKAYYGGTIGELKVRNDNGTRLIEAIGERFNVYAALNVVGSITASNASIPSITGSLFGTASFALTASHLLGSVASASYAATASLALNSELLDGLDSSAFVLNSQTSSMSVLSASFAATASSADTFVVRTALTASGLNYPSADNGAKSFIQSDGAGNLSLQYVEQVFETVRNASGVLISKGTPIYISGSTGDNGDAYIADASDANKMPAVYIAGEDLAINATGLALVGGLIEGVNTTGYPAGTIIYVGEGGGYTNNRPTGSNSIVQVLGVVQKEGVGGQGVVINQLEATLPNLQTGYAWVGNGTNQPVAIPTSSLSTPAFPFTGSAQITGSLGITGSIFGRPTYITTAQPLVINEAGDGTTAASNLILVRNVASTNTGSVDVSGSNNFIALGAGVSNTTVLGGGAGIIRAFNSIVLGSSPTITGSNGSGYNRSASTFANTINTSTFTLTDNRPTTTTAPIAFTSNFSNGGITATLSTGSLAFNNNLMFGGGGTVINVTGSNGLVKTLSGNILGSFNSNRIDIDSNAAQFTMYGSMMVGNFLTASLSGSNNSLNSVSVLGYQLAVSGSGPAATTTTMGSTYVGRWNALDSTSQPGQTAFAVGTGTSNAARRTSFHVSASGLTTVRDGLNVTGSFNLVGSASISQTLQLSGQDPLPTGATGMLAVSQSLLWFYDATQWRQVSLV